MRQDFKSNKLIYFRMNCAMFFQNAWLIPTLKRELPNEKAVRTWKTRMETTLDQVLVLI